MTLLPNYNCSKCGKSISIGSVDQTKQCNLCFLCKNEEEDMKKYMESEEFKALEIRMEGFSEAQERIAIEMMNDDEPMQKVIKYTKITEEKYNEILEKMYTQQDMFNRFTKNVGTVHDIDQFSFESDVEEYFVERMGYGEDVSVSLLQNTKTEGLFQIKICIREKEDEILDDEKSLKIIKELYGENITEVYINYAAHIVYLIELYSFDLYHSKG